MKNSSLKTRITEKFGEGFYKYIFKEQVDAICSDIMVSRFYHKKYDRFYSKRVLKENDQELFKFREREYYKTLFLRVYKEYGETVLRDYKDSIEYLEMLDKKRQETHLRITKKN